MEFISLIHAHPAILRSSHRQPSSACVPDELPGSALYHGLCAPGRCGYPGHLQRRAAHAVDAEIRAMSCDDDMARSFLSIFLAVSTAHIARLHCQEECSAVSCQSLQAKHLIVSSLSTTLFHLLHDTCCFRRAFLCWW